MSNPKDDYLIIEVEIQRKKEKRQKYFMKSQKLSDLLITAGFKEYEFNDLDIIINGIKCNDKLNQSFDSFVRVKSIFIEILEAQQDSDYITITVNNRRNNRNIQKYVQKQLQLQQILNTAGFDECNYEELNVNVNGIQCTNKLNETLDNLRKKLAVQNLVIEIIYVPQDSDFIDVIVNNAINNTSIQKYVDKCLTFYDILDIAGFSIEQFKNEGNKQVSANGIEANNRLKESIKNFIGNHRRPLIIDIYQSSQGC